MKWTDLIERFQLRLMVTAVFGLVVGSLVWVYINRVESDIRRQFVSERVLVAKRFVGAGKMLSADFFEEISLPSVGIQPAAIRSIEELKMEKGALKTRAPILKGQQLVRTGLMSGSADLGLAWSLAEGETAFGVRLSLEDAVAGLVRPGDRVHVFVTLNPQPGVRASITKTILMGIRVAAVGSDIDDEQPEDKSAGALPGDSVLVTLAVSPRQAARLALATDRGRLSLALESALGPPSSEPSRARLTELADE